MVLSEGLYAALKTLTFMEARKYKLILLDGVVVDPDPVGSEYYWFSWGRIRIKQL